MSVVQVLNVKLQRADQSVSWGFNVQGGKEFHCPLVIQKVNPNSLAERCSIRPGDYILRIGNIVTENLSHNQGRDAIIRQGNNLELTLQRGAPPRSDDYNAKMDFPQHQLMTPENIELKSTLSPQVGIQLGSNKALLTQSYNSPMGLYSSQNIADTLVTTIKNVSGAEELLPVQLQSTMAPMTFSNPVSHRNFQQPAQPQAFNNPYQNNPINQQRSTNNMPQFNKPVSVAPPRNGQRNINRGSKGSASLQSANPNNMPTCSHCFQLVRGPFISAIGKVWCPNHFTCAYPSCGISLQDVGFVEEEGKLYCEKDWGTHFAPTCNKCKQTILAECCYALDKSFHPECFTCAHCKQQLGSGSFHLEDGVPYCPKDFAALFATKCAGCDFPIEAGDQFFEAIGQNWHVECFNCSTCHVPLTNTGFSTKGNKPFCRKHAH